MKVMFVHSGADLYGASRALLRLAFRLLADGKGVTVVLPYDGPLRIALSSAGAEVHLEPTLAVITRRRTRNWAGVLELLRSVPRSVAVLRSLIRRWQPDIVHTNTAVILTSGIAARLEGVPHVWHVRESFLEFGKAWKLYQWFMFVFSTVIVCISEAVGSQFSSLIRRRKLVIIHDGVPAKEFPGVSEERIAQFRRQYGLGTHSLVGVVGRIKLKRKGQDTFVKAIPHLSVEFPETRFVLIGSPFPGNEEHLSRIQEMVGGLGVADSVIYTGDVEDIQAAYAALDVCVLPSEQPEPLGLVIIEAMASRKPVVGTRIGGPCEVIEDEKTGLLVTPGDPLALAVALQRLLRDSSMRKQFGEAGRLRFEQLFEFDKFYHRLEIVYSNAVVSAPRYDQRTS